MYNLTLVNTALAAQTYHDEPAQALRVMQKSRVEVEVGLANEVISFIFMEGNDERR